MILYEEDVKRMLGGFLDYKDVRKGHDLTAEFPIEVVCQHNFMNIGNLDALKGRGFEFTGCGVNDDGDLYLCFDIKDQNTKRIEK